MGGGCAPFGRGLGPHATQYGLGLSLSCTKWHLDPSEVWPQQTLAEICGGLCPLGDGAGSASNTTLPRPRPTIVPSGILIHPIVWPQQTWAEHWGLCLLFGGGEMGLHLPQCGLGRCLPLYQVASWSIQPFGHNRHGQKIGGLCPLSGDGELGPHLTQWRLGRGLPPYQVVSWSTQPFGMQANAVRDGRHAEYRWRPLRKFHNSIPCTMPQSLADAHGWHAMQ